MFNVCAPAACRGPRASKIYIVVSVDFYFLFFLNFAPAACGGPRAGNPATAAALRPEKRLHFVVLFLVVFVSVFRF